MWHRQQDAIQYFPLCVGHWLCQRQKRGTESYRFGEYAKVFFFIKYYQFRFRRYELPWKRRSSSKKICPLIIERSLWLRVASIEYFVTSNYHLKRSRLSHPSHSSLFLCDSRSRSKLNIVSHFLFKFKYEKNVLQTKTNCFDAQPIDCFVFIIFVVVSVVSLRSTPTFRFIVVSSSTHSIALH